MKAKMLAAVAGILLLCVSAPVCAAQKPITLTVCNWEEYIDEGGWDEEEAIGLSEDQVIFGENSMTEDFCLWYEATYGVPVEVEYSTFGTNEDLYNQLKLGDTYDLVCPSEYMIMKLMVEGELEPYDASFFDEDTEENYYVRGVSPYIRDVFEENEIGGEPWGKYAAGYMWGTTGIVYNPEEVSREDASTWAILSNPEYFRRVTIKDNVRDAYFAAVGQDKSALLTDAAFVNAPDYRKRLAQEMNDVSPETIARAERLLRGIKENVYSFETDSGKADMVTGKIVANFQWSGDAVYIMDQADEDGVSLEYSVPEECTNLWFDGWVMLKSSIRGDAQKKHAAQAFVNYLSRPDNAVRNMYYIGYTSVISGGEDAAVFDYADWCYGAEGETDTVDYDVSYFFGGGKSGEYVITAAQDQTRRQLFAQYPPADVIDRSAVMNYFGPEANAEINQMWINVRCFDVGKIPAAVWLLLGLALAAAFGYALRVRKLAKADETWYSGGNG